MKISIITPAPRASRSGNRVTAARWLRMLRDLGHTTRLDTEYRDGACDLLVALHARRSYKSIARFSKQNPGKPIVVALTGTDLYRDGPGNKSVATSLELADRLIVLQPKARDALPSDLRSKARVIYQSAEPPAGHATKRKRTFDVCVIGHLRRIKDPFRAALAARRLSASSRVRVLQLGAALEPAMVRTARREMRRNPRYHWLGEKERWIARRVLASSRVLVLSSRAEGGANVISEAISASVPVLASRIPGSVGLLGEDYPGYFSVGDTSALRNLLVKAEMDSAFLTELQARVDELKQLFKPSAERRAWRDLLAGLPVS